jgi:xanthine dehydrogenase accessory factor
LREVECAAPLQRDRAFDRVSRMAGISSEESLVEAASASDEALPTPCAAEAAEVLRSAADAAATGARAALATVVARRGSTPSTPGQKLLLTETGVCLGTVGGGAVERAVLSALMKRLRREPTIEEAQIATYKLGAELGMCCGGGVDVLIETIAAATPALLVGAGHIGSAAAPLLASCGFAVTLVDEREEWAERDVPTDARVRRVTGDFGFVGKSVPRRGVALTMTHDHQLDQRVVEWALRERFAFVGGVGSRAKAARTRARLEAKGFAPEDIARVRMPIGLSIGARTPNEIAISIVAELVAWKRGAKP